MKPACALHRNAQAAPNSSVVPKRFAGLPAARALVTSSTLLPSFPALNARLLRSRLRQERGA